MFLRELRKRRHLTQEELAHLVGVHETTIRRWEAGRNGSPDADDIAKLCEVLHVSEGELLNGPERQEWVLKIKISMDMEEEIDMTDGGCVSDINLTRQGAALTVGANYATFEDEGKFERLIAQLRAARDLVIENGRKMAGIAAAGA